jgi:hypothetical protein
MFLKSPNPDISAVSVHGKQFDVVNGFIEVLEEELTPEIETTLKTLLGFVHAAEEEVASAVTKIDASDLQKNEADERKALLAEITSWGLRVDGRKNLAWLKERYEEFVAQGHIKPGEKPNAAPAAANDVDQPPVTPENPPAADAPAETEPTAAAPVFEDDPAAVAEGETAAETTGEDAAAAS